MLLLSTFATAIVLHLSFISAADSMQEGSKYIKKNRDAHKVFNSLTPLSKSNNTITYIEKADNALLMPAPRHINLPKKHNIKKNAKRTIQKIIKKARKSRKTFLNQATSTPTEPSLAFEEKEVKPTMPTTQATQKKKVRKWGSKYARYPMPFQKLQARKDISVHHRIRREADRDIFILQDLDEMEFLSGEDGTETVRAHVKKYW